jgi:hypothetical protein
MALAKHRTKKEIEKLVRRLDPHPDVPPRIEPLGPGPRIVPRAATWEALVTALAGPVRDLPPGERPSEWMSEPALDPDAIASPSEHPELGDEPQMDEPNHSAPRFPERYKVQFTATQEYVDLLEEARDLLSHAAPNAPLDEVHQRALECLVKDLRKKKFAETAHPREATPKPSEPSEPSEPRPSSRYIPAAVRRRVAARDCKRCTYVDARGKRCDEARLLEYHHLDAHANGGKPTEENLTLRCRAHNALAAEQDFGRDLIREKQSRTDPRQRGYSDHRDEVTSTRASAGTHV